MSPVFASTQIELGPTGDFQTLGRISLVNMIPVLITGALIIAGVACVVFLIFGGIRWITSGGDKGQLESARGMETSAIIGLIIIFSVWAILRLIQYIFQISILSPTIPRMNLVPAGSVGP